MFPIKNGLKQGDALYPLLFNFAIEYAITRVQGNQEGLKLNGTYQLIVYTDDVNILSRRILTIKKNTETLVITSKEIGLEENYEKPRYTVMSHGQTAVQNYNIKTDNRSFEREEQFTYLGGTLSNQNSIWEEIKSRLRSGFTCYRSVQNILSSHLQPKNIKIKIHRTQILPAILYGTETWSLTLREEHRLRVLENRVPRQVFWPQRDEVTRGW
jgi:hypothetical protein